VNEKGFPVIKKKLIFHKDMMRLSFGSIVAMYLLKRRRQREWQMAFATIQPSSFHGKVFAY